SVNTAKLVAGVSIDQIRAAYEIAYSDEQFLELLPVGEFPKTSTIIGENKATIGLAIDEHANRLVSVCAIDNLVKGTGGAAIQSMNIALGLPEAAGLTDISLVQNGSK
ncbi:MAG: hypothetical protein RL716_822, partial [Actinomycetota bacterium]